MGFFEGWTFRTSTPEFEEGEVLELYTTEFDETEQTLIANVGDTRFTIDESNSDYVDRKVTIRVTSFDPVNHRGSADLLSVQEENEF